MNNSNTDGRKKTGRILIELSIAVVVITAVVGFGYYQAILNNWKVLSDKNLFFEAFIQNGHYFKLSFLNQESLYIYALSVFFSFLGNKEEVVFAINLILHILGMGCFYLGAKKIYSKANPLIAFALSGVLSICVYSANMDTSMHIIWFFTGLLYWLCCKLFVDLRGMYLKLIMIGILLGVASYVDLAGFILVLFLTFITILAKEFNTKEKALQMLCLFLCVINAYFVMFYLWNNFVFNTKTFYAWLNDRLSFFLHGDGMYQYVSLAILIMVSVIFYLPKNHADTSINEVSGESVAANNANENPEAAIVPAESLKFEAVSAPTGEEIKETEVKAEEVLPKPIKFIENPLPLPKKHVKKEMNYAFEPSEDQMHYDYNNYTFDDDYDLKDI